MPGRKSYSSGWLGRLRRLLRNRLSDAGELRRALPADALQRIGRRVTASEQRHTGQVRICIEAGLPWSYIRRNAPARQRAITQFGKLRVWDTAHNNGVLIYLLLAEHAIEIVADRGIDMHADPQHWQDMARRMGQAFGQGRFEDGVTLALEEVSALLVMHFPAPEGGVRRSNELPDAPVVIAD